MVEIIRSASKIPIKRDTLYRKLKTYDPEVSVAGHDPLVSRNGSNPLSFLN